MEHFGVAVGTLVLVTNVVLLASYTFGCHSLRHLIGGFLDEPSKKARLREGLFLRELPQPPPHDVGVVEPVLVGFTDVYVRLCAMGVWHDFRFF